MGLAWLQNIGWAAGGVPAPFPSRLIHDRIVSQSVLLSVFLSVRSVICAMKVLEKSAASRERVTQSAFDSTGIIAASRIDNTAIMSEWPSALTSARVIPGSALPAVFLSGRSSLDRASAIEESNMIGTGIAHSAMIGARGTGASDATNVRITGGES